MPAQQPHVLMCPPDHYGIEYEINPWMDRRKPVDRALAASQWNALKLLIEACGARVSLMTPVVGLPDLVFTANAALIFRQTAVLANFRHPQRQGETPLARQWLASAGFDVVGAPEGFSFEGAGDALFCGDTLLAGYRIRSDARGQQQIGALLGQRVIPLELVDPYFYHLDTCFCPLSSREAIYFRPAFDEYGQRVLDGQIEDLVSVTDDEARAFACNAVVVGRSVITNTGCPRLHAELAARGYEPRETPLSEFVKSGGSAKCLTLRLDGEDAAAWKMPAPGASQ